MRVHRVLVSSKITPRQNRPLVKICGIRTPFDAKLAIQSGADLIGMILWPKTKRAISIQTASEIAQLTKSYRMNGDYPKTIGVFVEETASEIQSIKQQTGIDLVQLHGDGARAGVGDLDEDCPVIYVLHVDQDGQIPTPLPPEEANIAFTLLDGMKGGSGVRLPVKKLQIPSQLTKDWILAGGLTPDNVHEVLTEVRLHGLSPKGVDVSSGVCDESGLRKSRQKIEEFIKNSQLTM